MLSQRERSAQNVKTGREETGPSLLRGLSGEGRADKRAALALLLGFLRSVACCQIPNGL